MIDISSKDNSVNPPYNPFIFVNDRNREVHLVNYPPTNKADMELFNTQDDVSNTSAGIYYIARYKEEIQLMPFGINLPNIVDFNIPAEGVKIYNTYPDFIEWVKSDGSTHKIGIRNKGHVAKPTIEHKTEKRSIAESQSGYAPLSFIRNLRKVTFCQVPQFPVSPYLSVPPWLHFRTMQGGISSLLRSPHAKC